MSCTCATGCSSPDWQTSCRRAARDGLRGRERREHGDDPELRRALRRLVAAASDLPAESDRALGLVDFALYPHLDHERFPENSLANTEKWAARIPVPTYAIDDQTAIKVTDGTVEVVSEGHWKLFTP